MLTKNPRTFSEVVAWGLCVGCGACAYACKRGGIRMVHVEAEGYRPVFDDPACANCTECVAICPGARVNGNLEIGALPKQTEADHEFGPALEVWEGWATDPEVRYRGSSGGLLSALSLYCLEQGGFAGVLHAGMDPSNPWTNRNHVSRNREDILARTGSRYAPSSPCSGLTELAERADGPHVFIGKPCDTAAVSELRRRDPRVREKVGLVMTFFCAGTPSTQGTLHLMEGLGVKPEAVRQVHYRGDGWPGRFRVITDTADAHTLSYHESWGRLTSYRPLRCNLCPDGLGRVADLSCGDAWDRFEENGDPGRSLVLVRTELGRRILSDAVRCGYVTLRRAEPENVLRAQQNLLERRRSLFGRLAAFRLLGIPTPAYDGFSLFRSWRGIGPAAQMKSVLGTLRRIIRRGWYARRPAEGMHHEP